MRIWSEDDNPEDKYQTPTKTFSTEGYYGKE